MVKKKLLSVIVPAYREKEIGKDLKSIEETLAEGLSTEYNFEIICVVDGRVDETWRKAKAVESPKIKVLGYDLNHGKGYAIRYGIDKSVGEIVAIMDAGGELHPNGLLMGLEHLNWYNADIIVGSKRHPVSIISYPITRRLASIAYQLVIRILFGLKIRDTQVGLKLFRRKVIDTILPKLTVDRYAFDIEMLALANQIGYRRIYESPVEIHYSFDSLTHASTIRSIAKMFWDTLVVFYRLKIRKYS